MIFFLTLEIPITSLITEIRINKHATEGESNKKVKIHLKNTKKVFIRL